MTLSTQTATFQRRRERLAARSRATASLQLICGIDLDQVLAASEHQRLQTQLRIGRALERERLRGLNRHWSYDLNRHIALKQALDLIQQA